jgi:hypothetical protein
MDDLNLMSKPSANVTSGACPGSWVRRTANPPTGR